MSYNTPDDDYGEIVYDCEPKGNGMFLSEEREEHLKKGAEAIAKQMRW